MLCWPRKPASMEFSSPITVADNWNSELLKLLSDIILADHSLAAHYRALTFFTGFASSDRMPSTNWKASRFRKLELIAS